jgi:hypothetical protein
MYMCVFQYSHTYRYIRIHTRILGSRQKEQSINRAIIVVIGELAGYCMCVICMSVRLIIIIIMSDGHIFSLSQIDI